MEARNHHLVLDTGEPCAFVASPNFDRVIRPIYLIIHYTAGTTAEGAIQWFLKPQARASAHFVVDRDGSVTQMVPMHRRAWHAGHSQWGELRDLNSFSIGIELVNAGKLRRSANGLWHTWSGKTIPDDQVSVAMHKNEKAEQGWHEYTDQQIETVTQMGIAIANHYGIADVLGHDDVAPKRKVDPGPLFPLASVRSRIMGRRT